MSKAFGDQFSIVRTEQCVTLVHNIYGISSSLAAFQTLYLYFPLRREYDKMKW